MSASKLTDLGFTVADEAGGGVGDEEALGEKRSIVVAIEKTDDALACVKYVAENILKGENDTLHIVHVSKVMSPREEVSHGPPGTSLSYRDESLDDVRKHVDEARAWLRDVIVPAAAEAASAPAASAPGDEGASASADAAAGPPLIKVHLFVDKTTASSDDVAATLSKAADDLRASLLVLSKSNKTAIDRLFVGSVADKTQKLCGRPVLLVSASSETAS